MKTELDFAFDGMKECINNLANAELYFRMNGRYSEPKFDEKLEHLFFRVKDAMADVGEYLAEQVRYSHGQTEGPIVDFFRVLDRLRSELE